MLALAVAASLAAARLAHPGDQTPPDGARLFESSCVNCHNGDDPRAPTSETLRSRSPQAIVEALTSGPMRYQGLALTGAERRAIAEYLTGRKLRGTAAGATLGRCARIPPFGDPFTRPLWNGWGAAIENTHAQTADRAGLAAADVPRLTLKWAFGFPDTTSAWAQPTVAGGRVFIGSQNGIVYSLDARTGCIAWMFAAHAGVRASITIGPRLDAGRAAVYPAYLADQHG